MPAKSNKNGRPRRDRKAAPAAAKKPGPVPETLKLEGDWQANVGKALAKKKPAGGWPK